MLIPDVLTDILQTVRLENTILCRCELTAPWGIHIPFDDDEAVFHIVTRGQCWMQTEKDRVPIPLVSGDFVLFPHGHAHTISDDLASPVMDLEALLFIYPNYGYKKLRYGGSGVLTELLSGCFQVRGDRRNPLFAALPSVIHIKSDEGQLIPWLETTLQYIASEMAISQLGCQTVIARLADVLFIQAIRAQIAGLSNGQGGWLRALTDAEIGTALSLIHHSPASPWTVTSLAEEIPMSRSAFSARFTQLVGQPPMQYLTTWRMVKATELLRESQLSLQEIATKVGYDSEVAFRKAFKRWSGVAPGAYRRESNSGLTH